MGVRDLFFNISARDKTGAAFQNVRRNLRSVDGMAAGVSDRLRGIGRGFVGFGVGLTAITTPILFAFRDSLSLYDKQARAQAKVAQAVKSTGGAAGFSAKELGVFASGLQDITRFGDEDILNGVTAQLLTFTNNANSEFTRAQAVALDLATVLDGDLQSSAIMLGKALNDPVKGLSAMSRAGVTFSKDQADVIKSLAKTGEIAKAQQVILEELERQYGGQAKAAALAGLGPLDQLKNAWGDLKEEVGGVIAGILPPMTNLFKGLVSGFQSLPQPTKDFTVTLGLITIVAGPLLAILGGLTIAISAISAPVLLVVGGLSLLAAGLAALWPETDNATSATDNLTLALGDEITQSQLLSTALGQNGTMSVTMARVKLSEARARHENVAAIIAEQRALALSSGAFQGLTSEIASAQNLLNGFGFPNLDVAPARLADAFEAQQQKLANLLMERGRLLEADGDMSDQLRRTEENITKLETSLANAEAGVVTFSNGILTPIEPTDRLARAVGGLGSASGPAKTALDGLGDKALEVKDVFEGVGRGITDSMKEMFKNGRFNFESFGDFILSWGDKLLDNILSQVFDPLGDAIQGIFNNLGSGSSGGGSGGGAGIGGLFSSLTNGVGNFFGNLLGLDTGGELSVNGRNGIDRNVAAFKVSNTETIKVVKRGQSEGRAVNVYIQTPNPAAFHASKGQVSAQIARAVGAGSRFT